MKSFLLSLALLAALASSARAASDVYVRAGAEFKPVTIAVTPLVGDNGSTKVGAVIANDMAHSIFLTPLNPSTFPEKPGDPDAAPNLDAWKTINAQFVLTGRVEGAGAKTTARFRLWDVATGEQVAGEQYTADGGSARRIAHLISDAVFSRVTGEKGFFDSRVVFVDETGSKQ
jgi:TolB protein